LGNIEIRSSTTSGRPWTLPELRALAKLVALYGADPKEILARA
jgi:hypothetical protein